MAESRPQRTPAAKKAPVRFEEPSQLPTPSGSSKRKPKAASKRKASTSISSAAKRPSPAPPAASQASQASQPTQPLPQRLHSPSSLQPNYANSQGQLVPVWTQGAVTVDDSEEEGYLDNNSLLEVSYSYAWTVKSGKEEVSTDTGIATDTEGDGTFERARDWALSVAGLNSSIKRIKCVVYSERQSKETRWKSDLNAAVDYRKAVAEVLRLHHQEKTGLRVELLIEVEKAVGSAYRLSKAPSTSNSRSEQRGDALLEEMEHNGDVSHLIKRHWHCALQSCPNHTKGATCYWTGTNIVEKHVPVVKDALWQWGKDIKEERQTVERPSIEVYSIMRDAKERKSTQSYNHRKTGGSALGAANDSKGSIDSSGRVTINQFLGYQSPQRSSRRRRSSSPLPLPPEPVAASSPPYASSQARESPPREELTLFVEWAKKLPHWSGYEDDLEQIIDTFDDRRFDLDGIKSVSMEQWVEYGCAAGLFNKTKREIKKWRSRSRRVLASSS